MRWSILSMVVLAAFAPPGAWAEDWITQPYTLASPSPYPPGMRQAPFAVRQPGATAVRVFFEWLEFEDGWDRIEIQDTMGQVVQRFSGRNSRFWSEPVAGDTLVIVMTTDEQVSGRGFFVTQIGYRSDAAPPRPAPPPPSALFPSRIELVELTSAGTRPIDPWKPVELAAGGCHHSHLDLVVVGYDARDQLISSLDFRPQVSFGTGGENFGSLEPRGGNAYRFHAGATTVQGLIVRISDPRKPDLEAEFVANITTDHNCSIQSAPPPSADPGPPPPMLESGPLPPAPPPSGPAWEWIQVGVPYVHPPMRPEQETDFFFAVHPALERAVDFRIIASGPFRIRYVRADFQGGAANAWYATHYSFNMNPGEEFHIQVVYPSRGARLMRFKIGIQGQPGGSLTLQALVPR